MFHKIRRQSCWFGGRLCGIILTGAVLLGISLTPPAGAVTPQYVLIDLGRLNEFTDDEVIVFGMNNLGECVGMVRHSISSDLEAFVWLPQANYGEMTAGLFSIEILTGMTPTDYQSSQNGTVAYDINDAGVAVGRLWTTSASDAMVWDLTGTESPYPILVSFVDHVFNA